MSASSAKQIFNIFNSAAKLNPFCELDFSAVYARSKIIVQVCFLLSEQEERLPFIVVRNTHYDAEGEMWVEPKQHA